MSNILKISDIMTTNLITVSLDTTIYEVVQSMQEKKISSIVIIENNKPIGIITERDILKASLSPEENLKKPVSELMSSPVLSIHKNIDYRDAYMQMTEHKIRHLIIVDNQEILLGMISESDFLNHLNPEQLLAIKEVSKVMTADVLTSTPQNSVHSVLKLMAEYCVGGIVIQENNKAIGVVSERDALKLIQKSSTELQKPIRNYMSRPVITIYKSQTVLKAQSLMENSHIRRLVVVDDDNTIAGILTRHDLIKNIPDYYVEILKEMIERQKELVSQTQLKLNEETIFHNAMKSLPHNLVFMTNKEGIIQFINTKESQACPLPTIDMKHQIENLEGILFEVFQKKQWQNRVIKGETLYKIVKVQNKYAKFCYFNTSVSAVLNTKGEFEGYMYIARDISQQQTLEKELQRLNDNLQEAYKVAKIGNWELDAKSLNAYWSNEICDIVGVEHHTQGGFNLLETLVSPEDFRIIKDSLLSALQKGGTHEMVYEVFPQNGTEPCWVECRARRELDEEGKPKSLNGTLQDVTHRIKAEKRIVYLNNFLKAIRNINQLIVKEKSIQPLMQKICNKIVEVEKIASIWILLNDTENNFFSAGIDADILKDFEDTIAQGTPPWCSNIRDRVQIYKELPLSCDTCTLANSYQTNNAVVVPIVYEENFYGHIGFSIEDNLIQNSEEKALIQEMANDIAFSIFTIKEREAYKIELEKSYDMLYKLTENIPGAVYQFVRFPNGSSKFLYATQSIEDIYGVTPHDLFENSNLAFENIHPDDMKMFYASIEESAESLNEWNVEYRVNHPNKGIRWIHGKSKPEKLKDGSLLWHGIINDITEQKNIENTLRLFKRSVEASNEGIAITNAGDNETVIYVNPAFERLTEYSQAEVLGKNLRLLNEKNREQKGIQRIRDAIKKKKSVEVELINYTKSGREFISNLTIDPILDENKRVTHFVGIQKDITKEKIKERKLRQSATVFESTTEGVMITDAHSTIIDSNEAFSTITGYKRSEVIGAKPSILKSGRHTQTFYTVMWNSICTHGSWRGEIWNRRKNGEIYPQWLNISSVKNNFGKIESFISVFSDITALKASEEKLDFLAHHDHLTELPNRILLKARLEHTINSAKRDKTLTAIIFMDIDNFKNINDSYGHTLGDRVLVAVAKRINKIIKEDDTLARIGGDEFIVVMNHFKSPKEIGDAVQKIMDLFEKSFIIENKEFWITLSIGISIAPLDGTTTEILIKDADTAMYEAKEDGKNTYKFYNDKMSASSFERIIFESALKMGIKNHEFEVHYQPQEDLRNNTIIGFEALVRWHHPTLGMVSPARFIPIAEETKMILPIGEFVLQQACKDIKNWHQEGLCKGRIAVNVSGVQLEHSDFAEILKYCLSYYEVDPSMIEIEVTESMVMKNPERWISILEEIKRIGVSISIDDFGTGYSSLSYLRRLPANTLKIDQSFVQDTPDENDACAIVDAIINMANSLGLDTLAEGVETKEQRKYLVDKKCKYAQGYLLCRPMSGKDTYNWLQERKERFKF